MKTCRHCGSQLEDQAKFCRYCGKPAEEENPYTYQQQNTGYSYGGQQSYQNQGYQTSAYDQGQQGPPYNQGYNGYQPTYVQQSKTTCGFSVASLVLGIIGIIMGYFGAAFWAAASIPGMGMLSIIAILMFLPSILGVLLGIVGISKTKDPSIGGRGLAIAGLVLGAVFLVIWAIVAIYAGQIIDTYGFYFDWFN